MITVKIATVHLRWTVVILSWSSLLLVQSEAPQVLDYNRPLYFENIQSSDGGGSSMEYQDHLANLNEFTAAFQDYERGQLQKMSTERPATFQSTLKEVGGVSKDPIKSEYPVLDNSFTFNQYVKQESTEPFRQEQLRQESFRQEQPRQESFRQEQPRQESFPQEQLRQGSFRQESRPAVGVNRDLEPPMLSTSGEWGTGFNKEPLDQGKSGSSSSVQFPVGKNEGFFKSENKFPQQQQPLKDQPLPPVVSSQDAKVEVQETENSKEYVHRYPVQLGKFVEIELDDNSGHPRQHGEEKTVKSKIRPVTDISFQSHSSPIYKENLPNGNIALTQFTSENSPIISVLPPELVNEIQADLKNNTKSENKTNKGYSTLYPTLLPPLRYEDSNMAVEFYPVDNGRQTELRVGFLPEKNNNNNSPLSDESSKTVGGFPFDFQTVTSITTEKSAESEYRFPSLTYDSIESPLNVPDLDLSAIKNHSPSRKLRMAKSIDSVAESTSDSFRFPSFAEAQKLRGQSSRRVSFNLQPSSQVNSNQDHSFESLKPVKPASSKGEGVSLRELEPTKDPTFDNGFKASTFLSQNQQGQFNFPVLSDETLAAINEHRGESLVLTPPKVSVIPAMSSSYQAYDLPSLTTVVTPETTTVSPQVATVNKGASNTGNWRVLSKDSEAQEQTHYITQSVALPPRHSVVPGLSYYQNPGSTFSPYPSYTKIPITEYSPPKQVFPGQYSSQSPSKNVKFVPSPKEHNVYYRPSAKLAPSYSKPKEQHHLHHELNQIVSVSSTTSQAIGSHLPHPPHTVKSGIEEAKEPMVVKVVHHHHKYPDMIVKGTRRPRQSVLHPERLGRIRNRFHRLRVWPAKQFRRVASHLHRVARRFYDSIGAQHGRIHEILKKYPEQQLGHGRRKRRQQQQRRRRHF